MIRSRLIGLLGLHLVLAACGAAPTAEPPVAPPTSTATPEAAPHPSWTVVHDARFGYSFAMPCWWTGIDTPDLGVIATHTIQSYDEAYFLAHSTRGSWTEGDYPEGAYKMDLTGVAEIDPSLTPLASLTPLLDNDVQELVSSEQVTVGPNSVLLIHLRSRLHPEETARMYAFGLAPDVLLMVSAYPDRAFESPDVRGVLESMIVVPGQPVTIPTYAPSAPLIQVPEACVSP